MIWECCGEIQDTRFCPHCGAQVPNPEREVVHTLVKHLTEQRDAARKQAERAALAVNALPPGSKKRGRFIKLGRTWTIQSAKYDACLQIVLPLTSSEK